MFLKMKCDIPFCVDSDFILEILSWENGVLQLVSEQVGPSDQVDRVVASCVV